MGIKDLSSEDFFEELKTARDKIRFLEFSTFAVSCGQLSADRNSLNGLSKILGEIGDRIEKYLGVDSKK